MKPLQHFRSLRASMKPLAFASRVLGLAPGDMGRVPFKLASLYSLLLVAIVVVGTGRVIRRYNHEATEGLNGKTRQTFITDCFMAVMDGMNSVTILVMSILKAKDKKFLFNKMEKIDVKLHETSGKRLNKNLRRFITVELLCVVAIFVGWDFTEMLVFEPSFDYFKILSEYLTTCIDAFTILEFFNFVNAVRVRFLHVNRMLVSTFQLKDSVHSDKTVKVAPNTITVVEASIDTETVLKNLRVTHNQLFQAVGLINSIFGLKMLGILSQTLIELINRVYVMIMLGASESTDINKRKAPSATIFAVFSFWIFVVLLSMFVISFACHWAAEEASKTLLVLQECLLVDNLELGTEGDLQRFSQQVERNKVVFSAFGLFNIDKTVLLGITATTCTYMVVLVTAGKALTLKPHEV